MYECGTLLLIMSKSLVTVKCYTCEKDFEKTQGKYNEALKINPNPVFYCCRTCFHSKRRPYQAPVAKVKVECSQCKNIILKYASQIRVSNNLHFCNAVCNGLFNTGKQIAERIELTCTKCKKLFYRRKGLIELLKTYRSNKNPYCSRKCSDNRYQKNRFLRKYQPLAKYKLKSRGKSYLEYFLEEKLRIDFPDLKFISNGRYKDFELDFYFPDLLLAIEINGIFHYKPIHGDKILFRIQERDVLRKQICINHHVDLQIIPVLESTTAKTIKEKYWDIFQNIILNRFHDRIELDPSKGFEPD